MKIGIITAILFATNVNASSIDLKEGYYGPGTYFQSGFRVTVDNVTGKISLSPSLNPINGYEGGDGASGVFRCDFNGRDCSETEPPNRSLTVIGDQAFILNGQQYDFGGTSPPPVEYFYGTGTARSVYPYRTRYKVAREDLWRAAEQDALRIAANKCSGRYSFCDQYGEAEPRGNCESFQNNDHQGITYTNICSVRVYVHGSKK